MQIYNTTKRYNISRKNGINYSIVYKQEASLHDLHQWQYGMNMVDINCMVDMNMFDINSNISRSIVCINYSSSYSRNCQEELQEGELYLANLLWQVDGACLVSQRREQWCGLRTSNRLEVSRRGEGACGRQAP